MEENKELNNLNDAEIVEISSNDLTPIEIEMPKPKLSNNSGTTKTKELSLLQSTLSTLQDQQVYQIQLIGQLHSQLTRSKWRKKKCRSTSDAITDITIQKEEESKQYSDLTAGKVVR